MRTYLYVLAFALVLPVAACSEGGPTEPSGFNPKVQPTPPNATADNMSDPFVIVAERDVEGEGRNSASISKGQQLVRVTPLAQRPPVDYTLRVNYGCGSEFGVCFILEAEAEALRNLPTVAGLAAWFRERSSGKILPLTFWGVTLGKSKGDKATSRADEIKFTDAETKPGEVWDLIFIALSDSSLCSNYEECWDKRWGSAVMLWGFRFTN